MLPDLDANSDDTPFNSPALAADADRVYFRFVSVVLTHVGGAPSYTGPLIWDEYPNSDTKQFFIQKNHRLNDGRLAATGWLEVPEEGRQATSDFLLTIEATPIPLPAAVWMGLSTLGVLGLAHHWRRWRSGR